ncbi:MinD/ParA family ATP-binding protein [Halostella litorea]|uniref:MinD/ParA family ATP-binding protein n=1 Tax=Halostella litorea TaxID=2528831 RepID=UPI001093251F|nr:AAA family ATPase [Halostella litorea]
MIAIAGGKGGCGKTTTALGLARALADAGRRVLAVDADRDMPNLHALAGVPAEPTLADAVEGPDATAAAHPDPTTGGVRIFPASPGADLDLPAALSELRGADRHVLLDCPAGAGPDAAAPLRAADATLLVSLPTPESLRDAAKTAAMARELDAPPAGAVVVRTDDVPDGVGGLLGVDRPVAVPDGGEAPLRSRATVAAFRRAVRVVDLDG